MMDFNYLNNSGGLKREEEELLEEKENELNKINQLCFLSCNVNGNLSLDNIYNFNQSLSFYNIYSDNVVFNEVYYDSKLIINNKKFNKIYNNANIISNKISIIKSSFNEEVNFSNSSYTSFKCDDSIFNKEVIFKNSCFKGDYKSSSISKNKFYKVTDFSYTTFCGDIIFQENIFYDEVNFLGISIDDISANRETFRFIKYKLDSIGNHIEANKMFAKEMDSYDKELTWKKSPAEKFLLKANKCISNFGQNYIRPLTLILFSVIGYEIIIYTYHAHYFSWLHKYPTIIKLIHSANKMAKHFIYINTNFEKGIEFVGLLFYIFLSIFIWHLIVAVKRHTKR
ncbi:hypothetical protein A6A19_08290 [Actinobacillus delphinicola]|uniref:hypothetical protein n=1 Tax=Actinobacillus delphinicola TaxID=51161 RepID=UPI002442A3DE|nr:hypothetical protein [Actinobacillus delphinicola]MDG6897972.1 hypothetical protein [Actinobacillus delphinicola]